MPQLRLALAQINPTVGDLAGNTDLIVDFTARAQLAGADIVAFPELALNGYPVEDLVFRDTFVSASRRAVAALATRLAAAGLGELVTVVGYLDADGPTTPGALAERGVGPRNRAAVIHRGRIVSTTDKHHLPNYGVFDENRHFVSGTRMPIIRLRRDGTAVDVAVVICEDIWQADGPIASAAAAEAGLVVSINSSPYERNKDDIRLDLCARRAREARAPLAYVNAVGGQDDLVFDGDSVVVNAAGELVARAGQFVEQLLVTDLELAPARNETTGKLGPMVIERIAIDLSTPPQQAETAPAVGVAIPLDDEAEVWAALRCGLHDYVVKNGLRSVVVGVSGGIDSALVAALACDAIGADRVYGVAMPSSYSSGHSLSDAQELAYRTGLHYRVIPIAGMVDAFNTELKLSGLAEENLQARVRGTALMAISNSEGHLVLATGNKSEYAVGYSTLYGDAVGGFAPIKDVYKTWVWRLARWRNEQAIAVGQTPPIPENSITKPPSAELRPGQLDTDSLPDYELLDALLARYIDGDEGRATLTAAGFDPALVDRVVRLVDAAEYKRRQSAPGTKISLKAFGRDRRLPITSRWRDT